MPGATDADEKGFGHVVSNGVVGWLFAVSGPVAIILTVAIEGGLGTARTNSWIFAAFVIGGILSVPFSVFFRQPAALVWTNPAPSSSARLSPSRGLRSCRRIRRDGSGAAV